MKLFFFILVVSLFAFGFYLQSKNEKDLLANQLSDVEGMSNDNNQDFSENSNQAQGPKNDSAIRSLSSTNEISKETLDQLQNFSDESSNNQVTEEPPTEIVQERDISEILRARREMQNNRGQVRGPAAEEHRVIYSDHPDADGQQITSKELHEKQQGQGNDQEQTDSMANQ